MPYLEAVFRADLPSHTRRWVKLLPLDREISLGRREKTDQDDPWRGSDWVVPETQDTYITGCQAILKWVSFEGKLTVRRRLKPSAAPNPILYHNRPTDVFSMLPGEAFSIGKHRFYLHDDNSGILEEAKFLTAISTEPENLTPRLVYADWLEERGDPRAEFLRWLCRTDLAAHQFVQLQTPPPSEDWSNEIDPFRRGFREVFAPWKAEEMQVVAIHVRPGDHVRENQPLLTLRRPDDVAEVPGVPIEIQVGATRNEYVLNVLVETGQAISSGNRLAFLVASPRMAGETASRRTTSS